MDKEFTGEKLLQLVLEIEGAVGMHAAGATPLGIAVTTLCEKAANDDPELKAKNK